MEYHDTRIADILPYTLEYREDGVFLILCKHFESQPIKPPMLMHDLKRRGIIGLRDGDIILRLHKKEESIRIADPQEEKQVDTNVFVTVSKDGMSATMSLMPPTLDGVLLFSEEIITLIEKDWGVTYGVDNEAVEQAVVKRRWYQETPFATGRLPVDGENASLQILFKTDHNAAPRVLEDGNVDYKDLSTFTTVKKGDTLVIRTPPEPGMPGCTVQNNPVAARSGKDVKLPSGKNVSQNQDGTRLLADKDGRVDLIKDRVEVSDEFVLRGNVDMSVGNVDFTGDIKIKGNVIAGMTIKATGNIEVDGAVEAATLIAGQNIILKNGIQGMDKAMLRAGGNIVSRFLERCTAHAEGNIHADYIVHSNVTAGGSVMLQGRRGRLIGGVTRASKGVTARTMGTPTGERTIIEVGPPPEIRRRFNEYTEKVEQCKAQIEKINTTMLAFKNAENVAAMQDIRKKLLTSKEQLQASLGSYSDELESIRKDMIISGGTVNVSGEAFHDVKVIIDNAVYYVRETIQFATFKCRDGEIVFTSFDADK